MEILPQIRVSFFFLGDEFNIEDITKKIGIIPTKARKKEDFPISEFAHTEWVLDTKKESCKAVSVPFKKLINMLNGKEIAIRQICNDYNVTVGFLVDIWMENGDKPEMALTKESISFLASIDAEVSFDLFID